MKKAIVLSVLFGTILSAFTTHAFQVNVKGAESNVWVQVNTSGFGEAGNRYASSMCAFKDHLFVGTGAEGGQIWRSVDGRLWEKIASGGFAENNRNMQAMASFNEYLYVGTENGDEGCQIWRSATGELGNWEKVVSNGFIGDSGVIGVYVMTEFKGFLYAGTGGGAYHALTLWRSDDGTSWSSVTTDGFGDSANIRLTSMCVFGNYLYVGTSNEITGGEVWRSLTGEAGSWELVSNGGFGDWRNTYIYGSAVFNGYLYLGTERWTPPYGWYGGEIWRTNNGLSWERVITDGFGDIDNTCIYQLTVFEGSIYAGTTTFFGCQVWKSSNGLTWTQANTKGFGSSNNAYVMSMGVFHDSLFVGTSNSADGCEIWASPSPKIIINVDIDPDSLNLQSNGQWITAYIEFPEGYDIHAVEPSSLLLNETIPADPKQFEVGDHDKDAVPDLMVKFDKAQVESYITSRVNMTKLIEEKFMTITLVVSGSLNEGTPFLGSNRIKVVLAPQKGHKAFPK